MKSYTNFSCSFQLTCRTGGLEPARGGQRAPLPTGRSLSHGLTDGATAAASNGSTRSEPRITLPLTSAAPYCRPPRHLGGFYCSASAPGTV
jgi:hypothetical protein